MSVNRTASVGGKFWSAITAARCAALAVAAAVLTLTLGAGTVHSKVPPAYSEGAAAEDLRRIEDYLNAFDTVEARFRQSSSNGEVAEGDLYLSRPGRLRIEYSPPVPVIMISNGTILMYYDRELDQFSHVPLSLSPASILLEEAIDFHGDTIDIVRLDRSDGMLWLTVVRHEDPQEGTVTLIFDDAPLALREWIITDAQGIRTRVSLIDARFDTALDPQLFELFNPRFQKERW